MVASGAADVNMKIRPNLKGGFRKKTTFIRNAVLLTSPTHCSGSATLRYGVAPIGLSDGDTDGTVESDGAGVGVASAGSPPFT